MQLKLVDFFTTEIEIEKSDFVKRFKENVDAGGTGIMFSSFEIFSSGKNEFKGSVNHDGFKIRRRKKLFDMNMNMAVAEGIYRQKDNLLVIETEINSFHNFFILFYIFGIIFYVGMITTIFLGEDSMPLFVSPFILFHAVLMFGIPYYAMRRSTQRMKYELEREFFYMTKR